MDELARTDLSRFLTFRSNGRLYALPAREVAEIIPVPPVARLPQSPKALLGMGNLRGSVIAVASLRALLGLDAEAAASPRARAARAIVLDSAAKIAITVDTLERLVTLDRARLDPAVATGGRSRRDPAWRLPARRRSGRQDFGPASLAGPGLMPRIARRAAGSKTPVRPFCSGLDLSNMPVIFFKAVPSASRVHWSICRFCSGVSLAMSGGGLALGDSLALS
jgi:chemotaxis signal transduction protein